MLWVLPGVELVHASFFFPTSRFIKLDFPTFDLPAKTISGSSSGGKSLSDTALIIKSASIKGGNL